MFATFPRLQIIIFIVIVILHDISEASYDGAISCCIKKWFTTPSGECKHKPLPSWNYRDTILSDDESIKYHYCDLNICDLKLKRNSAPAADGITAEHLIYSADSDIVRHITKMLTLCVQFGVVPDNFTNGLLIPIPKKAGCDTSVPKN